MADESIRVTRSVSIPIREIELRFSRSSGPGGQHAQRTETRVEAVFDVSKLRAPLKNFLEANGLEPCDDGQLVLKRRV